MANPHISFPSIEAFRHVIKTVRERGAYHQVPTPKSITFEGTVKLHGTNAALCKSLGDWLGGGFWCQSRTGIITPVNDNAGFAIYAMGNIQSIENLFECVHSTVRVDPVGHFCIFGEWCGGNIQKGVAINQMPKTFIVFAMAHVVFDSKGSTYNWFSREQIENVFSSHRNSIANSPIECIFNFKTWKIDIDFTNPQLVTSQLIDITNEVEKCCPVGKDLANIEGVGEGVVWRAVDCTDPSFRIDDLIFKVKGEKHSVTKVKTLVPVDVEKVDSINEFVEAVVTEARLQQGVSVLREQQLQPDIKNMGVFLKWVGNDIIKEESDTLDKNNLTRKEVMTIVNNKARQWFMHQLE